MCAPLRPRVSPRPVPGLLALHPLAATSRIVLLATTLVANASAASAPDWTTAAASRLGADAARLTLQSLENPASPGEPAGFDIVLAGRRHRVSLEPASMRAPGFQVLVQRRGGRMEPAPVPPAATWRGRLDDVPGSTVEAAQVAGAWHATIRVPREGERPETWTITPLVTLVPGTPGGQSVVARLDDLPTPPGTCGMIDDAKRETPEPPPGATERLRALSPEQMLRALLACDADSEFYALNGSSVANTVADIEAVLNGARAIYERDIQLTLQIGTVIVRTVEPDPYTSTNPTALLGEMRLEWMTNRSSVPRDAAQLFTGKDIDGSAIGTAYIDGMCSTSTGYSVVQSRWSGVLDNRIENSTHELGHNLDATHCNDFDYNCRIMCSSIGGCSGGIRSFGPEEVSWLRGWLPHCSCLDSTTVEVNHVALPINEAFPGMALDATRWTGADRYTVEYGRLELDHKRGYGTAIYLGTARTLPINLVGFATLSYRIMQSSVPAGQQLWTEYFETRTLTWKLLDRIISPGGVGSWLLYTHTLGESARGSLFALRFTAYGGTGATGAQWYIDDVSITEDASAAADIVSRPPARSILRTRPNPFGERTEVTFTLDVASRVRLDIFDLRGWPVLTLLDAPLAPGTHARSWDGRDAAGLPVAGGLYFVRLQAGAQDHVTRVIRLPGR